MTLSLRKEKGKTCVVVGPRLSRVLSVQGEVQT
jgi:hypothetical protein